MHYKFTRGGGGGLSKTTTAWDLPENSREVTCSYRCTEPNFSPAIHPYLHNLICHGKLLSKVSKNILLQHLHESVREEEERQAKGKGTVTERRLLFLFFIA